MFWRKNRKARRCTNAIFTIKELRERERKSERKKERKEEKSKERIHGTHISILHRIWRCLRYKKR
jgi:hypothetical protein